MAHKDQLKHLLRRKSLVRGTFTLASGKISDYYIDCKLTTLDPEGAALTGYTVLEMLEESGIEADAITGPPSARIPLWRRLLRSVTFGQMWKAKGSRCPRF